MVASKTMYIFLIKNFFWLMIWLEQNYSVMQCKSI